MVKKPVHPMLVHFPIALLVASFVADVAYFVTSIQTLRDAGWWMLVGGAAMGLLTVRAGMFDMHRVPLRANVHEGVHRHRWVGIALVAVMCGLTTWRWTFYAEPSQKMPMLHLDIAFLAVALAAFQGWLGGELVYEYAVFVNPEAVAGSHAESSVDAHPANHARLG